MPSSQEWFVVMTLHMPSGRIATKTRTLTVEPGTKRHDIFEYMFGLFGPEGAGGTVMYYNAAPDQIGASTP